LHDYKKICLFLFVISLIIFFLIFAFYLSKDLSPLSTNIPPSSSSETEKIILPERTNILVLGDDARPGEGRSRTDTIMLISLEEKSKQMAILSIPRDTRVAIPGRGYDRLNAAYAYGGADLTIQTVAELLDLEIHYYIHTNFDGFKDIIDTLGGVTINVDRNMYYPLEGIHLKKGEQLLDGDKALQFVRYREYPLGDITRTEQQQRLLKAIANETLQLSTFIKLPKLLPQLEAAVDTNFSITDALLIVRLAKQFESPDIVTQTLPGTFQTINGIEYWQVNIDEAKKVVRDLFKGITTSQIFISPAS